MTMATSLEEESYGTLKYQLNSGIQMPAVGLGTYRMKSQEEVFRAVDYALDAGYHLIDTAAVYRNEAFIGDALCKLLPKYKLKREDIFITSKISPSAHGTMDTVERACLHSLKSLGVDYIDLYLIHFPGTSRLKSHDSMNKVLRQQTWTSFVELYDKGLVKAIGVSNFTIPHLCNLLENSSVTPAVNQVEFHPYYNQQELLMFCKERGIVVQAYSSFGGTSAGSKELLDDAVIKRIAHKYEVSCAQVALVWALQKDIAVIPKSTDADRIKENISLNIRLTEKEINEIDSLSYHNMKYAWDPADVA